MRTLKLTTLALALAAALPTQAADPNTDVKKELDALKAKVADLEAKQKSAAAAPAAAKNAEVDEMVKDFNRIAVKTEALEDSRDASGFKGLKISGYMDPTYIYNANKQRGTFQFLNGSEAYGYDNSYFGTVSLDLLKETDSGAKFHLNLVPVRATGYFTDGSIVNEASAWIPLGDLSTKLIIGQVADWSGYEYQSPVLYKNTTHNLLFDFTLPYYYTGVGLELIRGKLDLKMMVANFNQSIRQIGESVPMFVFRGDHATAEYYGFGFAGAVGYKNNFRSDDVNPVSGDPYSTKDTLYTTLEVDGWYTRGDLTLNGHAVYGAQKKAAITPDPVTGDLRDSQWYGASALLAYKFTKQTEGILRLDYLSNQKNGGGLMDWTFADASNGIGPDQNGGDPEKGADKYAITAGVAYYLSANVTLKAEYRYDGATQNVFGNKDVLTGGADPKYTKSNSLVATQAVVYF